MRGNEMRRFWVVFVAEHYWISLSLYFLLVLVSDISGDAKQLFEILNSWDNTVDIFLKEVQWPNISRDHITPEVTARS